MDEARLGLEGFAEDAAAWRRTAGARVPSYDRLLAAAVTLLESPEPRAAPVRAALAAAWAGRRFVWQYERPLLLLAALRFRALAAGAPHPLWPAIAAEPPRPEAITVEALGAALEPPWQDATLAALVRRAVQTNETSRAMAWLWPAHLIGADDGARALALIDVGASAGLNLIGDRLPVPWRDAAGVPLPVVSRPALRLRLGLDQRPLDVRDDDSVAWLRACLWPGEVARRERLELAVAAMRAAAGDPSPPRLEAAEASEIPARIAAAVATLAPGTIVLAYQTVFVDYVAPEPRRSYEDGMARLVANAPVPVVWLKLELNERAGAQHPAALEATVRTDDGVASFTLAECGYHPQVVEPDAAAVSAFRAATAAR